MNRTRLVLAAALLMGTLGAAQAEGFYAGANLGAPDWRSGVNGVDDNSHGVTGKLYGGYQITPNIAVEGGYQALGHIDDGVGEARGHGVFVDAVGSLPVAPQWSLIGRAGVAHGDINTSYGDDTSSGVRLGVGAQYDITPTVALRGEYERNHFTNVFDDKLNVDQYTVGVKVGF